MNGTGVRGFFTGNQLKLIAAVAMTIDHIGVCLFPQLVWLRAVGRIAFPIFAYFIGEGFVHTRSRKRYWLTLMGLALIFQTVFFVAERSLYQGIFVTFSGSLGLCFLADMLMKKRRLWDLCVFLTGLLAAYVFSEILPEVITSCDFEVDYGYWGMVLPVTVVVARSKGFRMALVFFVLVMMCMGFEAVQWWCLCALPFLALYNGKRGKAKMKSFFYIYYPLHMGIIWLIAEMV